MGVIKPTENQHAIRRELEHGGAWLGASRTWMQSNVNQGSRLEWSSNETIHIPFNKLQELALAAAVAAVAEDRAKRNRENQTTDGAASMADAYC